VPFLVEIGLGVAMNLVLALAGALLLSLICEKAEAQVAREAFYSIPSETVSAPDFLMGKKGTPVSLGGQLRLAKQRLKRHFWQFHRFDNGFDSFDEMVQIV